MNNVNQVQNTNQMSGNNPTSNENDSKKIFTTLVLVLTLMICTTSATYAYFAISASSNNVITGNAATASLTFVDENGTTSGDIPKLIAPTNASYTAIPMVPQYSWNNSTNVLQLAFNGAAGKDKCVDGNSNVICKAYQVRIKNTSTATAVVKGQIKFAFGENSSFENLKWKLMDSATAVTVASGNTGTTATTSFVSFVENVSLIPNQIETYYLILWIEEIGVDQNSTDHGTFYGTVQFINQVDGSGVTSTITG